MISEHNFVLVEMSVIIVNRNITPKTFNAYRKSNEAALNKSFELFD